MTVVPLVTGALGTPAKALEERWMYHLYIYIHVNKLQSRIENGEKQIIELLV